MTALGLSVKEERKSYLDKIKQSNPQTNPLLLNPKFISICGPLNSGKTQVAFNLAIGLRTNGLGIVLITNAASDFKIFPQYHLQDHLQDFLLGQEKSPSLERILVRGHQGIMLIPDGSIDEKKVDINLVKNEIKKLKRFNVVLSDSNFSFEEVILVLTPERKSFEAAFNIYRTKLADKKRVWLLVNQSDKKTAFKVFDLFEAVLRQRKMASLNLEFLGSVSKDSYVWQSLRFDREPQPFILEHPGSLASSDIRKISQKFHKYWFKHDGVKLPHNWLELLDIIKKIKSRIF